MDSGAPARHEGLRPVLRNFRSLPLPARAGAVALVLASLVTFLEVVRGLLVGALHGDLLILSLGYALLFLLPLGAALLVLRRHRFAHLSAIGTSLFILGLTGGFLLMVLPNPGLAYWSSVYLSTCALLAAMIFAALGHLDARFSGERRPGRPRLAAAAGHLATLMVGIAAGGLVVGLVAGGTIVTLLGNGDGPMADVIIARGSWDKNFPEPYQPKTLVVSLAAGATVTWYNADTETHTVTADDGSFDSGLIAPGESWSHTFTSAGSQRYHCTPHPWMKGEVVVS